MLNRLLWLCLLLAGFAGCDQKPAPPPASSSTARQGPAASNAAAALDGYMVVSSWPHDPNCFTQGLVFLDGYLYESGGLNREYNGQSSLRKVQLTTGAVLQKVDLSDQYFAEGLAAFDGKLFQLTWKSHKAFVYDLQTFQPQKELSYDGEGWGLTTDGKQLILSDGTDRLRFLDPATFEVKRSVAVRYRGEPLLNLNELEYVRGEIFANIWQTDFVARIDPVTGNVSALIDFTGLLSPRDRTENTDVLNGIAYDETNDRLFVTGKRWPKLFEVKIVPR